jgi:uncharacterized protein (TIGR00375 family)
MLYIADLHIHSRYSRACSRDLILENIDQTGRAKGVDIIATGDFTFPDWFRALSEKLEEISLPSSPAGSGLYKLKTAADEKVRFLLSTELSLIYKQGDKVRRIHIMVMAPNLAAVAELNKYLDKRFNIRSDGRPILGLSAPELVKLCLSIHPEFLIYPAHIWTPWFAVFGSKSGFNSMAECFGDQTEHIYGYETGLSSDPEMNWRLSALDNLALLSNSDAHSLPNIGREATVFKLSQPTYQAVREAIINSAPKKLAKAEKSGKLPDNRVIETIEFYPEEGMYHYDGHRECGVRFTPAETKKHKGICPVCRRPLTVGVLNRVEELADRPPGSRPEGAPGFKKLVELDKIIAEALGIKSRRAQKVKAEYNNLTRLAGTEMYILREASLTELKKITLPAVVEGIRRMRAGELIVEPGFDGQYGTIKIFHDNKKVDNQQSLF